MKDLIRRFAGISEISYSQDVDADFAAEEMSFTPQGLQFNVRFHNAYFEVNSNLLGRFNVSNCLAALATTVGALKIDPIAAIKGVANFTGVPGRMESIARGQEFIAMVDFAHTPNALARALEAARQIAPGKVIAVFGSAGLRDREKRVLMAEVSVKFADVTIITAEDPRTESLDLILDEMVRAARARGAQEGASLFSIPDRGNAIRQAVALAEIGDIVMVCGKGHEKSMCFGTIEYPWDDRTALQAALAEKLGIPGPQMPWLPTS